MTTDLYRPLTTFSYLFNYAVLGNGADPDTTPSRSWLRTEPRASTSGFTDSGEFRAAVGGADLLAALVCHIRATGATG